MAAALSQRASFAGAALQCQHQQRACQRSRLTVNAAIKKLNSYDEGWAKGIGSIGYFAEDKERASPNVFKQLEKKKILSSVEKAGLLSAAEKAGLSLSKIEQLGLLSTAERLGLLTLAEDLLTTEPGKITSASLPFIVGAVGAAVLIPHDSGLETALSYTLALALLTVAGGLFITGFVVKGLQDD